MNRLLSFAQENGWPQLLPRLVTGAWRRLRDGFTARRLTSPGFRAGAGPRLLGLRHIKAGRNFSAGDHLWLEAVVAYAGQVYAPELVLGDDIRLSDRVHIACLHKVVIGSGLLAGSGVLISDHTHGSYKGPQQSDPTIPPADRPLASPAEVVIGRNVWLGEGVAVLAGARIGDGAIVGANSVVTGVIPPNTIALGSPARAARRWDPDQREWIPMPPPLRDNQRDGDAH